MFSEFITFFSFFSKAAGIDLREIALLKFFNFVKMQSIFFFFKRWGEFPMGNNGLHNFIISLKSLDPRYSPTSTLYATPYPTNVASVHLVVGCPNARVLKNSEKKKKS